MTTPNDFSGSMTQLILPPHRPLLARALFALRRQPSSSEPLRAEVIQNRIDAPRTQAVTARKRLTHGDIREACSFAIDCLFHPIRTHERSNKALFRKVMRATGIGMRRIEKLWRKYVEKPNGLELATLSAAYFEHVEAARGAIPEGEGAEHAEQILRAAVGYGAARWTRAVEAGTRDRARGAKETSTPDAD